MIVRKRRIGNGRQISNFETDERTHYPAFAECVCAENVLNFAMPAKPESGCQITTLGELLEQSGDDETDRVGKVIGANRRGQRPRELLPAPTRKSCGMVRILNLAPPSMGFLNFS
jgi:hypothetical protein